ncbi:At2g23090 like protein [Vararia minispora EC-137]|uniref:At2g23090 like protein n=1 Tax=Vararia minispora EC-137 TaxID=1314806 RepID=A0ACB8QT57_9AGAM|nr:At2g23090 like protein [Vararia minispora EC-137]
MGNVSCFSISATAHDGAERQGAKAAQKRERNADKNQPKGSKSQAKVNEAAKNIVCSVCRQSFLVTTRAPALEEHSQNKHSKTMAECFPNAGK